MRMQEWFEDWEDSVVVKGVETMKCSLPIMSCESTPALISAFRPHAGSCALFGCCADRDGIMATLSLLQVTSANLDSPNQSADWKDGSVDIRLIP